ncbi:hypothetical protein LUZ63_010491 [Rhynchospora breviuscula]|uniref:MADS-box domain-containing protein n=1 Tax=Rhynchospora breviuscula TaxID=2022672 RepID=A0A9Q0HQ07_9POAL|nr:hypothetical protein LUZ63_010491 [Rhynchospora breviuscula]
MGKNKIKIEKIETEHGRKVTYKNRIGGLVKKAKELSILCDVPVLLVTASPNDVFTATVGPNRNFEDIIQQYADQTPEARQKSKLDTIEKLKKSCSEDGNSVGIEQMHQRGLPSPMNNKSEGKKGQLKTLQDEIFQIEHILGPLGQLQDLDKVESLDTLLQMESILLHALRLNDLERFAQQVQIQCSSEVQNMSPQEVLVQPLDIDSQYQSQSQSELWEEFDQMLDD